MKVSVQNRDNTCSTSLMEKRWLRLLEEIFSVKGQAAIVFNLQLEVKKVTTSKPFFIQLLWKKSKYIWKLMQINYINGWNCKSQKTFKFSLTVGNMSNSWQNIVLPPLVNKYVYDRRNHRPSFFLQNRNNFSSVGQFFKNTDLLWLHFRHSLEILLFFKGDNDRWLLQ